MDNLDKKGNIFKVWWENVGNICRRIEVLLTKAQKKQKEKDW